MQCGCTHALAYVPKGVVSSNHSTVASNSGTGRVGMGVVGAAVYNFLKGTNEYQR